MRGLLSMAVVVLLPVAAFAQWRGAPAPRMAPMRASIARSFGVRPAPLRGGFAFRPSAPSRVAVAPQWRHGATHGHFGFGFNGFQFGVPPQNRCFSDAFFDPFFCTRTPRRFASFVPCASFVPFASYPFYSMPVYDEPSYTSHEDTEQLQRAQAQVSDLTNQIEQMREELQQMREEQRPVATAPNPQPPEPPSDEPPVSTTLVYRDGHRGEVENYAIVGDTLWIFNDQRRKKIPLAELDLQATQQANEDRGVEFLPPHSK
jgi:hypothetical protein